MGVIELMCGLAVLCALAMSGAWLIQRRTGNAGWVDAVWSLTTAAAGARASLSSPP